MIVVFKLGPPDSLASSFADSGPGLCRASVRFSRLRLAVL